MKTQWSRIQCIQKLYVQIILLIFDILTASFPTFSDDFRQFPWNSLIFSYVSGVERCRGEVWWDLNVVFFSCQESWVLFKIFYSRLPVIRSSKGDKNLLQIIGSSNNSKIYFPIIFSMIERKTANRNHSYQVLWD